ncbi:GspE/PulE family protein [Azospirillum sp. ST 5-10]
MVTPFDPAALAAWLLGRGLVDAESLQRARRVEAEAGERLDRALTRLGLVPERTMAEALAAVLGLAVAGADDYPDGPVAGDRLPPRFQRDRQVLALEDTAEGLRLAMADPLDGFARAAVEMAAGRPVLPVVAVPADLEAALQRLHRGDGERPAVDAVEVEGEGPDDVARLRDIASEAPVVRLVGQLIARAVDQRASDIHIEPFETRLAVRYRVDGVLHEQEGPPRRLAAAIVSRIKIMARLDIAERRLPQDGRLKLVVRGKEVDFRVATAPTLHGESVVLRILDWSAVRLDFASLGFDAGPPLERFLCQLDRPNGIVLVTGPTGSGKTTTLYAALARLNTPQRKVLTVEDPVEYQLDGINQIQVKPEIGLDFAGVLRSFLRHDPDVMMVGEIRDLETAQVATQAALTGHLVLSTLHTNGAAASISRLLDIGLADYLVVSALAAVVAQRLVRVLCRDCRQPYDAPDELAARLGLPAGTTLWRPGGCPACGHTGYAGRTGVYEVLEMDEPLRRAVLARADAVELHRLAVAGGMRTLFADGVRKAVAGVTAPEEVWRVTQEA